MDKLLSYAYESGICMATLYVLYWIFFRKETYFRFNRFYLLGAILVSFLFPIINYRPFDALNIPVALQLTLLIIYLSGVITILSRMILGMIRVYKLRIGGTTIQSKAYSMVFSKQNLAPFSFFRTVFMNESLLNSFQKDFILNHELIHIRQLHTFDKVFVEFCLALFWFNPFMWFIRNSLRHSHEYLADEGIAKAELDLSKYQIILMQQGRGISPLCVSNDFNLMIKERIRIMCSDRSSFLAKLKLLLIIPAALCIALVFVCPDLVNNLLRDPLERSSSEKLIHIDDRRDVSIECINSLNSIHFKNHDVEAKRVRLTDGREAYFMSFYLKKNGGFKPAVFGYLTREDFDVLHFQWQGDTAIVKLENSDSSAHMDFEWKPSESGSALQRVDHTGYLGW